MSPEEIKEYNKIQCFGKLDLAKIREQLYHNPRKSLRVYDAEIEEATISEPEKDAKA